MNDAQAREDIRIIKDMLDRTRRATSESGTLFIVWGVLITLALLGTWVLGLLKAYRWEWAVWVGVTVIGWVYSAFYGYRQDRKAAVTTYTQIAARHLYIACGAGFLLVGIALPRLGAYSYEAISILVSVVAGILFFVMGGLYEWPLLRVFGLVWWAGALGLVLVKGNDRILLYAVLFIVAYLLPICILRAKHKREQTRK
ncbi:MAG: hypothetical protein A2Y56_00280 [Candidatus Aminicenantes bacterium RBG_13_63_10]|nr:MAG: hypothetical protein A2Y56_00280 [Candidatus Aminicenantes bacterium RBG_13_63_10]